MTDKPRATPRHDGRDLPAIDSSVAHAARVYDYMLGGDNNFEVDRLAAEQAAAAVGGMDNVRSEVQANRAFLGRAVRFAAGEGVRQFLDIGTGIPNDDNVHVVAKQAAADARIVYVDNDPIVLAHAHDLLSSDDGSTIYIQEDLRNPEGIVALAGVVLDFDRPVALVLVGLLHHFRDSDDPAGIVARLVDAVPSGSYLVVSHLAADIQAEEMAAAAAHLNEAMEEPWIPRSHAEVARFFAGLDLVEPGLVQVDLWRPSGPAVAPPAGWTNPLYVGVGRKP